MGRFVCLDVGERRIGVAVSDPTGTLARPIRSLRTTGLDGDALQISATEVSRLAVDDPFDAIVVGFPRRLDGSPNEMTPRIERFAARLHERTGLAVILQDERLTSVEAESRLATREKNWRVRKEQLDAAAAAVILQDYLDAHSLGIGTDPHLIMKKVVGLVLLVAIVAGGGAAGMAWTRLQTPYKGYTSSEQFVEIPTGAGAAEIRQRLVDAGIVQDGLTLRLALRWTGASRDLKAGEYRFERAMTAIEVVQMLARGDVYGQRITFPEGLTIREMAMIYESRGLGRARDFIAASRNTALIQDLDPAASDLEGYLFPETYTIGRTVVADDLIAKMVAGFRAAFPTGSPPGAEPPLTTRQVVTLASLIEKETGKADERPLVSAVYHNRLRIGMGMQADPTVVYALQKAGKYDGNIRKEDLGINSPYNTYRYPGLPPGPIASPGHASLAAALNPADAPFLYFVSKNDGSHVFATTLAEHNRNVQEFQVRYFQKRRSGR